MKKPSRPLATDPGSKKSIPSRRSRQNQDIWLHARSFHAAAKKLAVALEANSGPVSEFDASPVIFMYRHAVELHLKSIVLGEGGNFLDAKPDPISVGKTHSISWLAQFVSQIVTVLGWQKEFKCRGVESLSDFKAVVGEMSETDPGAYILRLPIEMGANGLVALQEFAEKMDALLDLLDKTGDALAAEWDFRT